MMKRILLTMAPLAVFSASCSTVDQERSTLERTLQSADTLADEVELWATGLEASTQVPQAAVVTLDSFQERADDLAETLDDISNEASAGVDLTGVRQALIDLSEFEADNLPTASEPSRGDLLAQFRRHADSVRNASSRAANRLMGG